jgi:hypothetical protein
VISSVPKKCHEAVTGKKEELYGPAPSTAEGVAASQDDVIMI